MRDAHRREAWEHTSALLAMIHNRSLGADKPKKPSDFHPYYKPPSTRAPEAHADKEHGFAMLRAVFVPDSIK